MTIRIAIALFAVLFVLASNALAEVHPNAKKIAKWEGGIAKRQARIDAEQARGIVSTVQYLPGASVQVRVRRAQPVIQYQPAPDFTLSEPAPVVQEAPPTEVVVPAPQVIIQQPPAVQYVAPMRVYRSVPVYREYREYRTYRAAPILGCPIFGAMAANYHARQAERHARKADYHAARAGL